MLRHILSCPHLYMTSSCIEHNSFQTKISFRLICWFHKNRCIIYRKSVKQNNGFYMFYPFLQRGHIMQISLYVFSFRGLLDMISAVPAQAWHSCLIRTLCLQAGTKMSNGYWDLFSGASLNYSVCVLCEVSFSFYDTRWLGISMESCCFSVGYGMTQVSIEMHPVKEIHRPWTALKAVFWIVPLLLTHDLLRG